MKTAFWQSLIMLRPDTQRKNPVMFTVEVGTVLIFNAIIIPLLIPIALQGVRYRQPRPIAVSRLQEPCIERWYSLGQKRNRHVLK